MYSTYTDKNYIAVIEGLLKACLQHVRPFKVFKRSQDIYIFLF